MMQVNDRVFETFFRTQAVTQTKQGTQIKRDDTAIVLTDPQQELLTEKGRTWELVRDCIRENNTIENIARLLRTAKNKGFEVFVSPHYYFPSDDGWRFRDPFGKIMKEHRMFRRSGSLSLSGFPGSGADWVEQFKAYIEDDKTVIVGPHKIYGPQTNDLVLQLRKRGIRRVILGGMLANTCVESHLRELLEQGFEVDVVKDATAAPRHPLWGDGYVAALINFRYLANSVMTTDEVIETMERSTS